MGLNNMKNTTTTAERKPASEIEKYLLPNYYYSLFYADYRDSFNENKHSEFLQNLIHSNEPEADFWNESGEMNLMEVEMDAVDYYIGEIKEKLGRELTDDEREETQNEIMARDDSYKTYFAQLLKNTGRRYFYYDLDFHAELSDSKSYARETKKICRKLKIDYAKNEEKLIDMLRNSFDGGQLVVLFVSELADILNIKGKKENFIRFLNNYEILIMDRGQGGGTCGDGFVPAEKAIALPFNRQNLNDDEADSGYSYSGDVCGMTMTKGNNAEFTIGYKPKARKAKENAGVKMFREREAKFEAVYKTGKCSFGDMKYNRHRNTFYRNDYPCGNKCSDCGTFWID